MTTFLTSNANSYAQLLTVLVIFIVVLGATALTTKWIAGYQKQQGISGNIELLDAARLSNNKYIQIVRIGESYYALAVCKDTVTVIGQVPADELVQHTKQETVRFKDILTAINFAKKEDSSNENPDETKDKNQ